MSIEKITSTILDEAREAEKFALDEAQTKCDQIIEEAKQKAQAQREALVKKGQEEKEKIILRRKSVAAIDSKKVLLESKQKVIKECFDESIERITNLPREEYIDYLVRVGINSDMYGGLLTFNEKEKNTIAKEVIEKLNDATEEMRIEKYGDRPYSERFELNEVSEPITGGFWIRYRLTYADNTVGTQVDFARTEMASEVSRMLFEEE
ncbi:MAG: V-type ATP synthase subunit E [Firmicutes bacterium]|nr:V-type ATP synthase subunit E [Bacillota bacterium]